MHRVARVGEDVDERGAEALGVGHDAWQRSNRGRAPPRPSNSPAQAAAADERQMSLMLDSRELELDRLREIEHFGDDAVQARGFFGDVGDRLATLVRRQFVRDGACSASP